MASKERIAELLRDIRWRVTTEHGDPAAWERICEDLETVAALARQRRDKLRKGRGAATVVNGTGPGGGSGKAKISARCHPTLGQQLRDTARRSGTTHSRLASVIVEDFLLDPGRWQPLPFEARGVLGNDTVTAVVGADKKRDFERAVKESASVQSNSQLLAWLLWNHLGRPDLPR